MEDGTRQESDRGTPQGGQISPILANVYLHYVLDQWFEIVLKKYARGEIYYVRYADDFLMLFQYEGEAARVLELLRTRLAYSETPCISEFSFLVSAVQHSVCCIFHIFPEHLYRMKIPTDSIIVVMSRQRKVD